MSNWDRFVSTFLDMNVAERYLPALIHGLGVTLAGGIAVVGTGIATGLMLALLRTLKFAPLNFLIIAFVDVFRALPPLAIILIVYFGLPNVGILLPGFVVLWLCLSLVLSAFSEEIFWAGITSVAEGQWMAGRATGLTFFQTLSAIILPQAIRLAVPPLTNRTISITKNLALGSAIGVNEILGEASSGLSMSSNATPLTVGAGLYVLVFIPLIIVSRLLERRFERRG